MRTRTRTIVNQANPGWSAYTDYWVGNYCNGSPLGPNATGTHPAQAAFSPDYISESITDEGGAKTPLRDKPVAHRRIHNVQFSVPTLNEAYDHLSSAVYGLQSGAAIARRIASWPIAEAATYAGWPVTYGSAGYTNPPPLMDLSPFSKTDQTLINNVYEKAQGLEADVLLNIAEAGQFIPSVKSLTVDLLKLGDNPQFTAGDRWSSLRRVLRTASGAYLAWKFGIRPILSDLQAIHKDGPALSRRIEQYVAGKTLRYSATATANLTVQSGYVENGVGTLIGNKYSRTWKRSIVQAVKPTRRVVLRVRPNRAAAKRILNALEVMRYRYATPPAQLGWELIPFSFIVDWFVDVRGVLRAIDHALGQTPWEVVSKSLSYTYNVRMTRSQLHYSGCSGSPVLIGGGVVNECDYKHYERTPISDQHMLAWRNRFGKNQAAITAALITQFLTGANLKKWGYLKG